MIDNRTAPLAMFLLRVALGTMFIAHALLKYFVFTMPGWAGFLQQVGYPAALAWPIVLAELFGGIALILGLYARWAAVALTPVLLGAFLVHSGNGWLFTNANGGWEYPLFLIVANVAVALAGEGAFAIRTAALPLVDRLVPRTA